jgi:hypothetical protein
MPLQTSSNDLMKLHLALEYEHAHDAQTLQPFFDSSLPYIRHPEVQQWGRDLVAEREASGERLGRQGSS